MGRLQSETRLEDDTQTLRLSKIMLLALGFIQDIAPMETATKPVSIILKQPSQHTLLLCFSGFLRD